MNKSFDESSRAAAQDLQNLMAGKVALPGDERYATARRVWNGALDRYPALIAFCESVQDVRAALRAARAHGLAVSVRGTGYDVAGRSVRSGALVIDLSSMNQVEVNARVCHGRGGSHCCRCYFRCCGERPHGCDGLEWRCGDGRFDARWWLRSPDRESWPCAG
jgi:hypothetical protein